MLHHSKICCGELGGGREVESYDFSHMRAQFLLCPDNCFFFGNDFSNRGHFLESTGIKLDDKLNNEIVNHKLF